MFPEDDATFLADWGEDGHIDDVPVRVIYGAPYFVDNVGIVGRSGSDIRIMLPASSLPPRGQEDPVVDLPSRVPSRYIAREVQPDGTGWVTLILSAHPQQP